MTKKTTPAPTPSPAKNDICITKVASLATDCTNIDVGASNECCMITITPTTGAATKSCNSFTIAEVLTKAAASETGTTYNCKNASTGTAPVNACTIKVPTVAADCTVIDIGTGIECCMQTITPTSGAATKTCQSYTSAMVVTKTTTNVTGTTYNCKTANSATVTPTPTPVPAPVAPTPTPTPTPTPQVTLGTIDATPRHASSNGSNGSNGCPVAGSGVMAVVACRR